MQTDPIVKYLAEQQARILEELFIYLRFPSVSAQAKHKGDLQACAEWLRDHCRGIGLEAKLHPTKGNPVLLARTPRARDSRKPHYLVYGHYDVQPPEPLELWQTPPFEPRLAKGNIYARGSTDNKGQHFAHLKAVEAYLKTGTDLPCDLTFLIEGEEEVGSKSLVPFLLKYRKMLKCDGIVVSDTGMPSLKHPALTYGLRGIAALEVKLHGPKADLHSGVFGGAVDNPAMALCQLLGKMRDKRGRVAVPGFYDGVKPLTRYERQQFARLPINAKQFQQMLGVPALFGEAGYSHHERRAARPTLEINGLTSGYQGEGSKTIVPAWASAKLTMRLVPGQDPRRVQKLVTQHLRKLSPPSVRLELSGGHGAVPYLMDPTSLKAQASLRALKAAFGHEPVLLREGGSIPIVSDFKSILGVDTLLLGLALPDDNLHSPNEKISLAAFEGGMRMSAGLWRELALVS